MKFSTREDMSVSIEQAFASATDFALFENQILRRGVDLVRVSEAGIEGEGLSWEAKVRFRGKLRVVNAEIVRLTPPTGYVCATRVGGLDGMCEGERRRIMVPWDMGYGVKGTKGVPPYSDLQYDFELVELSLPKIPKSKKGKSEL